MGARQASVPQATYQFAEKKPISANAVIFTVSGDYIYKLVAELTHDSGDGLKLEINGDTTAANYLHEFINADAAVLTSGITNDNSIGFVNSGRNMVDTIELWRDTSSQLAVYQAKSLENFPAGNTIKEDFGCKKDATITGITSIKLLTSGAGTLSGYVSLYRAARF